jgi:hypothetical protein
VDECIILKPHSTALIETLEYGAMPKSHKYSGFICSRVQMVSKGLSHISTTVDPDWRGKMLIAVHNHSSGNVKLKYGEKLCTMVILENKSPSAKPSNHPPGRSDVLLSEYSEYMIKLRKRRQILWWGVGCIYTVVMFLAYYNWGTEIVFASTLAAAMGLAPFLVHMLGSKT